MLKRYVVTTRHSESRTIWAVWDTESDMECVASFSSARDETFGDAWQNCYYRNLAEEEKRDAKETTLLRAWEVRTLTQNY